MSSLYASIRRMFSRLPDPSQDDGSVRIISGPVEVEIDGQRYRWTPRMEEAATRYRRDVAAAKARLTAAEAEYRDAMKAAAVALHREGEA